MPRIPEGKFNKTPSVRVQAQRVPTPQTSGLDRVMTTAQQLTGVMAKLQDQKERTQAYNAANELKRDYDQRKGQFALSLENAKSDGSYEYANPLSEDPTNPEIIKGNVQEDLEEMNRFYSEGQRNLMNLNRGDIASDLAQQYVGDDINLLRVRTGKKLIKEGQREQTENLMNNMSSSMVKLLDLSASNTNPELIDVEVKSTLNRIDREIAVSAPSIGRGNVAKTQELKERLLAQTAGNMLSNGLSQNSITVAEELVKNIKDPLAQRNAQIKMENIKKSEAARVDRMVVEKSGEYAQTLLTSDYVKPADMMKAKETADKLRSSYHDPKYSSISIEQKDRAIMQLDAAILSRHVIQENIEQVTDLEAINKAMEAEFEISKAKANNREPSQETKNKLKEAEETLNDFLERSLASTGLKDMGQDENRKVELFGLAKNSIRNMYTNLDENLASIRRAKNPAEPLDKFYRGVAIAADQLGLGSPVMVPKESINRFRSEMKVNLKKQDGSALNTFLGAMQGAGPYSRAVAMDLTKGDKKLEFMIPAADAMASNNQALASQIFRDAELVNTQEMVIASDASGSKGNVTKSDLEKAFIANSNKTLKIDIQSNLALSGLKTAIQNRAMAILVEGEQTDLSSAMEDSIDYFREHYIVRKSDDGKSLLMGVKSKHKENYSHDENLRSLSAGVNNAVTTLGGISLEDKRAIAVDFLKLDKEQVKVLRDKELGEYFKENFTIEPDPRQMNIHRVMYQGVPISTKKGQLLEYTIDELFEQGKELDRSSRLGKWTYDVR